jgi:hypothetical protein
VSRPFQKIAATLLGAAIAFPLFMSMGMTPHFNDDPGVLLVGAVLLGIACFAGR